MFPRASAAQDRPVAITNVTVIPGTGAPAAAGQTVVIQGGRIRLVGATLASPLPTDRSADSTTQVIDGTGRYLIPGLWDLHADLVHTARVAGVMLGGRWMDRRELDRLLAQSRAWGR